MKIRRRATLVALAAIAVLALVAGSATAVEKSPAEPANVQTEITRNPQVIYGGTTQSTDPTRYDYVPPASGGVTPMSATGYAWLAGYTFGWKGFNITVPATHLLHKLNGSGLSITGESATYSYGNITNVQVCNYQTQFQNRYGSTIYSTRKASLHEGCSYVAFSQSIPGTFTVKTGVQCARFFVNGIYRGEQCHQVFP